MMGSISVVLITYNEERRLESCLRALSWADEILVIDSESKDRTVEMAMGFTKKIYRRSFDNFSNQKNYGLDLARGDWILSVDADEIVQPELRDSLLEVARNGSDCDGFLVNRTNVIFGRRLRFGGQSREKILRFFRKGRGKFEQPIHEKVGVAGKVGEVSGELLHHSSATLRDYLSKLELYTDLEARWMHSKGIQSKSFDLWLKPSLRFFYHYVIKLGFLDGYPGFLYHSLSSFYYFVKQAKLRELHEQKTN